MKILELENSNSLEIEINNLLMEGWKMEGDLIITSSNKMNPTKFYQKMVRFKERIVI